MIEAKLTPEQRKIVDEFAVVRQRCMAWTPAVNPHAARRQELEKLILSWFENSEAAEPIIAAGNRYTVPVSMRENSRTLVLIPRLLKRLGQKWVVENFKPTLKSIEKALTKEELAKYVQEERSGARSIGEPVQNQPALKAA